MPTQRRRPTLKVRLPASPDSESAMRIVNGWKGQRQAGANVAKAIALYAALQAGDASKLRAAFPWLAAALGGLPSVGSYGAVQFSAQATEQGADAEDFGSALGLDDLEL